MSHSAETVYYISLLSARSGRPVAPYVAKASEHFFPTSPGFEDSALHGAVEKIANRLAGGAGPILADELRQAVAEFHASSGTPFCPPVIEALEV